MYFVVRSNNVATGAVADVWRQNAAANGCDPRRPQDHVAEIVIAQTVRPLGAGEPQRGFVKCDGRVEKMEPNTIGSVSLSLLHIKIVVRASVIFVDVIPLDEHSLYRIGNARFQ